MQVFEQRGHERKIAPSAAAVVFLFSLSRGKHSALFGPRPHVQPGCSGRSGESYVSMSQQRSGGPQYANSNINTAISRATSASSAQPAPVRYGPGLVSLGAPKVEFGPSLLSA